MRDNKKKGDVNATEASDAVPPITPDQPLIIDLPDGQKLVVGNMVEGSVIEVATWRGTGRPDSRTSRLMLGMSPGSLSPTVVQTDSGEKAKLTPKDRALAFLKSLQALPKSLFIKKEEGAKKEKQEEKHSFKKPAADKSDKSLSLKSDEAKSKKAFFMDFLVRSAHEQAKQEQSKQEELEIDKWLESIRTKTATQTPARKSTTKTTSTAAKSKKAKPATRKSKGK
ncbi:hypothetical protein [Candidatus Planktophila versatilis]|uniref:hypothetical protein n=1 Tax=Candidatus Planktophila versatilis TaxID=1884905 RepID=UPI003CF9A96E